MTEFLLNPPDFITTPQIQWVIAPRPIGITADKSDLKNLDLKTRLSVTIPMGRGAIAYYIWGVVMKSGGFKRNSVIKNLVV